MNVRRAMVFVLLQYPKSCGIQGYLNGDGTPLLGFASDLVLLVSHDIVAGKRH